MKFGLEKVNIHLRTQFTLLVILLLVSNPGKGQLENFIPTTPNAAELIKMDDVGINSASGIPNIEIPIYTISLDQLNISISINYNAGGIKVSQVASNYGLGWSLKAGGAVTREVRGLNDDYPQYGYMNATGDKLIQAVADGGFAYNDVIKAFYTEPELDLEPDRFFVSAPGLSTAFTYDQQTGEFVQYPNSNVKISRFPASGIITKWVIINDKGYKYYFGVNKLQDDDSGVEQVSKSISKTFGYNGGIEGQSSNIIYNQSWYLMEIESPVGNSVKYTYTNLIDQGKIRLHDRVKQTRTYPNCSNTPDKKTIFVEKEYGEVFLEEINFENGKLKFLKGAPRTDLINSYSIDTIQVLSLNGEIIKENRMEYSTVDASSQYKSGWTFGVESQRNKRLFLDQLTQYDQGSNSIEPYKFYYKNRGHLPERFSRAIDFWGYFNQKNNQELLPDVPIFYAGNYITLGKANRKVNTYSCQSGVLNKIVYPTKGSMEIEYESNTCYVNELSDELYLYYSDERDQIEIINVDLEDDTDQDEDDVDTSLDMPQQPTDYSNNVDVGGLRVKSVVYKNEKLEVVKEKRYNYQDPNTQNSSGMLFSSPVYVNLNYFNGACEWADKKCYFTSESQLPLEQSQGSYVGYRNIRESFSENNNEGYIDYVYLNERPAKYFVSGEYNVLPTSFNQWKKGVLLSKTVFENENEFIPISKDSFIYESYSSSQKFSGIGILQMIPINSYIYSYEYAAYNLRSEYYRLKKSINYQYFDNGTIENKKEYYYHSNPLLNSKVVYENSKGDIIEELTSYPFDCTANIYPSMVTYNLLNYPVESILKNESNVVSAKLIKYNIAGLPVDIYKLDNDAPISNFNSFNGSSKDSNYSLNPELNYLYTSSGKVSKLSRYNGINDSYSWAYDNQYPVVKIMGGGTINIAINDNQLSYTDEINDINGAVNYLKSLVGDYTNNPSYQVELYTYKPLVGITSQTDPNGKTTYYEYDSFNCLKCIKDFEGNILKTFEYNYANDSQ